MAVDDAERDDLLDRLGEEFAARLRRGEQPSLKEYTDRYPELADEIRELFPAMVKVEQVKEICHDWDEAQTRAPPLSQVGDYRIIREIGRGGMGVVYEAEQISLGRRVALKVLPRQSARDRTTLERFRREARASARLHHTNIVPVFEVGQDGEVRYYAMQFIQGQSLDSVIDELRRLRGRSPGARGDRPAPAGEHGAQRTDSETRGDAAPLRLAQTLLTGRLDQAPRVVADEPAAEVPEASPPGAVGPEPVPPSTPDTSAVMPGGAQLSSVESRHRAFHRGVAHIGRQAASALAHAHARGIVHRDVKPSNLLLDTEGVVWASDFGLAKVDEDDLTRSGDILGTLRYMAPERFRGRGDARADLYSLGLTLYELLVLRPAFDSPDRVALSEQIRTVEPPRPRIIDPRIPRDLETIVLKAIEKDPRARYASAEALAEDLRRFLDDEPILARRVRAAERYLRWARRNPVIAVLGAALTAVLVGATLASVLVAGRMTALARKNERAARREREANQTAQAASARAEQHLYIARIGQAEGALRLLDVDTARGLLDLCRPEPGGTDRRGWEWFYLDQWCRPELRTISLSTTAATQALAVSPDGRLLAIGCSYPFAWHVREYPPASAYVIGLGDGKVRHELVGHREWVLAVAFRPDGKCLATLGAEGTIRVWDTESGRERLAIGLGFPVLPPRDGEHVGLDWSPDGSRLAGATRAGPVQIWDPETGSETARIAQPSAAVAWSPDGTRIALGGQSGLEVRLWDARDGRPPRRALRQPGDVRSLAWSPDGRRLAAISVENDSGAPGPGLSVWDTTSGEKVLRLRHAADLKTLAFSPDGTLVATGGPEGIVRVFDTAAARERAVLFTPATNVSALAFSRDGRRLFAGGWGMEGVKVFDPRREPRGRAVGGWLNQLAALTFDRYGFRVLGIDWYRDGAVASADPFEGAVKLEYRLPVANDQRWPRGDFGFSPDGRRLAAPLRADRTKVGVWNVAHGRLLATMAGSAGPITAVALGPDGQRLATAGVRVRERRSVVTVWHVPSGQAIATFESRVYPVNALAWSGDSRKLAAGGGSEGGSGSVTVWDAQTLAVLGTLYRAGLVQFLAFHPDGARIGIADTTAAAEKVHIWDVVAGSLISKPGPVAVSCVGFTRDGKRLAALGYDGSIHLHDARSGDQVLVLRGFGPPKGSVGFTPRLAFSPDGSRIAAHYGVDSSLNLWDLGPRSGLAAKPDADDLAGCLSRSRALEELGDVSGAQAAYARACEFNGRDPSPWIEHAVSLWRRGDSPQARDALAQAMASPSEDAEPWIDLGRMLERLRRTSESETALAKARSLLVRRLSRVPDDDSAAADLAELLPEDNASRWWTTLLPDVMISAAGATLARLTDGSILAGGPNPVVDTYSVEAITSLAGMTGLRLEALPDPSLPFGGPGRSGDGNFHLAEIRLSTVLGARTTVPVRLTRAQADVAEPSQGSAGVRGALDSDPTTAWSIGPAVGRRHCAVFQPAQPIGTGADTRLQVELAFRTGHPNHALGRFRLSVTDRPVPSLEPSLMRLKADSQQNGLTRLAAAYYLRGEWASARAVLERSAERAGASTLEGFLLALALDHLGRRALARSACDRALERLRTEPAEDATRDVAAEALSRVRGLSPSEAESLLRDVAFPADPFAH